jgi:diguanylate cyclase (GGDEF)-like protein/PAS domain S-box-containing protein
MPEEAEPRTLDANAPEAQWQRAAQRVRTLQRIQVLSLIAIGLVVVVSTLGAGLLFLTSFQEQEAREKERVELVSIRDRVRAAQVDVLRKLFAGEAPFTAEGVLAMVALASEVERLASTPTRGEGPEEREARRDVIRLVGEFSTRLAAAPSREAFGDQLTNAEGQALFDQYFRIFDAWVRAHGEALADERRRQRAIVVRSGLAISVLVVLLAIIGLLIWWRAERARERVVRSARQQSRRFDSLVSNASDVVIVVGETGVVDYCSPSVKRLLGWSPDQVVNRPLRVLVHPDDGHKLRVASNAQLSANQVSEPIDLRLMHHNGTWMHGEALVRNLVRDEAVRGFVLTCRDVTDRKEIEAQLAHQAFHDPLTGLANRVLFEDRLAHALELQASHRTPIAVIVLDLDDFKTINDSMGHHVGDELLNIVGQRLQGSIRPGDTPARLGGDEYAVVLIGLAGPAAARVIAERISDAIREPVTLAGKEVVVSASIGIAMAPRDGDNPELLVRHADIAMYEAKARRGVHVLTFDSDMESTIEERMSLSVDLNRAVDAGDQLRVVYQPIVDLQTEQITGLEALLRWDHPSQGEILPSRFIHIAEQTGLIGAIGEWVLQTACAAGADWNAGAPHDDRLTISVNVSPRQLESPDFADTVARVLKSTALPAECLLLEVTESVLMGDVDEAIERLARIRRLGVRVAIDDFGTGYSSLSQLRRLPVDMVKIDKAFIDALSGGTADADITGVIVQLGAVLDLQTVAEGIELVEQVNDLQQLECRLGQGFFFASPMAIDEITRLLADQKTITASEPLSPTADGGAS